MHSARRGVAATVRPLAGRPRLFPVDAAVRLRRPSAADDDDDVDNSWVASRTASICAF